MILYGMNLSLTNFDMVSPEAEIIKWYELLKNRALDRNNKSSVNWSKYKNDLEETKFLLSFIPKKVVHDVMVPIGPRAIMPGKIVHTNEFLVNLGEAWFVRRSADQAVEICNRRIKTCDEMLKKFEKEIELIVNKSILPVAEEAFGSEERPEIIEHVTEEENEDWKKQHRLREKEYRQQLAVLRSKERKIETEEDLWKHLDELEIQEELEDELNRLNAQYNSEEEMAYSNFDSDNPCNQEDKNLVKNGKTVCGKEKKRVSFSYDSNLSVDEPLKLEIRHSKLEPVPSNHKSEEIISPSDIYNHYIKFHNKRQSILKKSLNFNDENKSKLSQFLEVEDSYTGESIHSECNATSSLCIKDVVERTFSDMRGNPKANSNVKKISKFKSMRMKNA